MMERVPTKITVINANGKGILRNKVYEQLASHVLQREKALIAELNVVFIDDREMIRLNRSFLNSRSTTDVISFRLDDSKDLKRLEGEVYVNSVQALRQAKVYNVSLMSELKRLVIHGILHLIGYDDNTPAQRKKMHSLENKYLRWKNH